MRYLIYAFFCCLMIVSCKEDKIDLSGNTVIKVDDFLAAFPELKLPITIADSNFTKIMDSTKVGIKLMKQFIPDSILNKQLAINEKTIVHIVGRIKRTDESYLLISAKNSKSNSLITFVLNQKNEFITYKSLLNFNEKSGYQYSVVINTEPTFSINRERKDAANQTTLFTKNGWAYTASTGKFMTVVNETNEDEKRNNTIINPIDTLPRKNLYSGNYVQDNKNFISIRDGKNANNYLFFIHFEKQNGTCIGELKGEMEMKDKNVGIYSENGDPCVIDFKFEGNQIILKEQGTCGNYREMTCFFEDAFTKKKDPLVKKKKR